MKQESYGLSLNEKTLKFLVRWMDIAQKSESISPDKEESDLIRRIGRKADELLDKEYDDYVDYSEYDLRS
mgnify:CR=1 FL=1